MENNKKASKKKILIAIGCVIAVLAIAAVLIFFVFGEKETKNATPNQVDASFSELSEKDEISLDKVDKSLKDYVKEQTDDGFVYTKGDETVIVKTDQDGTVNFISYNHQFGEDDQIELQKFNEEMIQIGDSEADVLACVAKDQYIYHLRTDTDEGEKLHVYYYGWTGSKAILELVFKDGKLTYYKINSLDVAKKSDAPDVDL